MSYGRILSAGIEIDGSELATDHSVGATTLDLDNALDYYEPDYGEVIQVRIVADDDTEELATIKVPEDEDEDTVDDEDGFITLDGGLVNAFLSGSRVEVYPETRRLVAQVRIDDAEEDSETVDAVVHHTLYDRIPEGNDLDIAVEMDYDGETFYVTNILGEQPLVDGTFIDPDTLPTPTGVIVADGLAPTTPAEAPVILRSAPAINVIDMSAYSRPADFKSFLTEFATSDDLGATFGSWQDLGASGTYQVHPALDYTLQYKYRYQVLDIEGLMSGFSPESDPVTPRQVGEAGAIDIAADSVTTNMLAALIVLTSMLRVENPEGRVDIGDGAIRAFDSDGEQTVLIDGANNFINGTVVTAILTVLENLIIRTSAELSGGAVLELGTGVSNPPGEPQTVWELESATLGTGTGDRQGLKYFANGGADGATPVFVGGQDGSFKEWLVSNLSQNRSFNFGGDEIHGAVLLGSNYYVLAGAAGLSPVIGLLGRATLFYGGSHTISNARKEQIGGIATDSTDVFLCEANRASNVVRVHRLTTAQILGSGTSSPTQSWDTTVELADDEAINDMEIHDGKWWFLISKGATAIVRVCLASGGARSSADDFDALTRGGLAWDGTQFRVHQRASGNHLIYKFTNWLPTNNVHAAYSYYNTTNDDETALSPIKTILLADAKKRWWFRFSIPSIPVGADRIRYYLLEGASATIATIRQQAESAATTVALDSYNAAGTLTAVSVTEFPADSPASIQSFSGNTVISGDDNHTIPGLFKASFARKTANETVTDTTFQNDDHLALAMVANATYLVECLVLASGPAAADMKMDFTIPSGATGGVAEITRWSDADVVQIPISQSWTTQRDYGMVDTFDRAIFLKGVLHTTNSGTLQLRWARLAGSGVALNVRANSYLKVERVA